jgi:FkbM family methyltransferase
MGKIDNNDRIELKKIVQTIRDLNLDVSTFLEIGSKNGTDSFFIQNNLNLDENKVFIMEPHPLFFKKIKKSFPNFQCYQMAAWNENKNISFNAATNMDDGRSSLMGRDIYAKDFIEVEVESRRVDFLIENVFKTKIDFCKIDVEGASYEVLQGFGKSIDHVKLIQIEAEQRVIWNDQKTFKEVYEFLQENGFEKIWEVALGTTQLDSIWVRK